MPPSWDHSLGSGILDCSCASLEKGNQYEKIRPQLNQMYLCSLWACSFLLTLAHHHLWAEVKELNALHFFRCFPSERVLVTLVEFDVLSLWCTVHQIDGILRLRKQSIDGLRERRNSMVNTGRASLSFKAQSRFYQQESQLCAEKKTECPMVYIHSANSGYLHDNPHFALFLLQFLLFCIIYSPCATLEED